MTTCAHVWVSNSGRGGDPVFVRNNDDGLEMMRVRCRICLVRQYMDWNEWKSTPHTTDPSAGDIRICSECDEPRNIRYFYRTSNRTAAGRDRVCSFCRCAIAADRRLALARRILTKPYS